MQCAKCSMHPALKKIIKKTDIEKHKCTACGIQLAGNDNFKCENCHNYFICNNCVTCTAGHIMSKVIKLDKIGLHSYYSNSFSCDSCHKTATPSATGVWHCKPCKYDICDACISKT